MGVLSSNMDVLLVSRPVAPGPQDGTVTLVRTLAKAAPSAGLRCTILVPAFGAPPPGVRARTAALPGPLRELAWRPLAMLSQATTRPGALRHYFFTPTPPVVDHLRRLHRLLPCPTVQTLCSTPADGVPLRPLLFADRVVALSRHTRDRLLSEGLPPERVAHIPPAVEPGPALSSAVRQRVRHRLGLPGSARLVLYLGDYDEAGAALAVSEVLPKLLSRCDAHGVLACRPKGAAHQAVRAQVAARIAREPEGIRCRVHLLSTIDWAPELAAAADVALFPARRLPDKMDIPLALLESMAAGVPAVVSSAGPLGELVTAGAAQGAPQQDTDRLADLALDLLRKPAHRQQVGSRARQWWREEASPWVLASRHRDLYHELTSHRREQHEC